MTVSAKKLEGQFRIVAIGSMPSRQMPFSSTSILGRSARTQFALMRSTSSTSPGF